MDKKNIYIILSSWEREIIIAHLIEEEILEKRNDVNVYIYATYNVEELVRNIFLAPPHIIFCPLILTKSELERLTTFKLLFNCSIITYQTEGIWKFDDDNKTKIMAGKYDYTNTLVDYTVFWGEKSSDLLGNIYLEKNRVKGKSRIKTLGYPLYENEKVLNYFSGNKSIQILKSAKKEYEKVIMFVTGFVETNFTKELFLGNQDFVDIDASEEEQKGQLKYWLDWQEKERIYRDKYTECIYQCAKKNPQVLFIIKIHPNEIRWLYGNRKANYSYSNLEMLDNITIVKEPVPICAFFPYTDLLIHYGSTCGLEAYKWGIPTLLLKDDIFYNDFFTSTKEIDIDNVEKVINYIKCDLEFLKCPENDKLIRSIFGLENQKDYHPTEKIANLIIEQIDSTPLEIDITCSDVINAKNNSYGDFRVRLYKNAIINLKSLRISEMKKTIYYLKKIYGKGNGFSRDLYRLILNRLSKNN